MSEQQTETPPGPTPVEEHGPVDEEGPDTAPTPADDEGQAPAPDRPEELPRTGVPEVDAVLDRVGDVGDRPVDEHVAVFERAHEDLRRALDGAGPD